MSLEDAMEPLFRLYAGLARQGPGSEDSTLRALHALPALALQPDILDLGCGPGAAALVLARETGGRVTAVDTHQPFLDDLERRAGAAGLSGQIVTRAQSMDALEDAPGQYDLVWSEGAIYIIGFERGLRHWRPLLRSGGYLCVSEASWLTDKPPKGAREFWDQAYPAMGTIQENIERARSAGFDCFDSFALPRSDWETNFYGPLRGAIKTRRGDPELAGIIEETEQEIRLYEDFGDSYGYVFYVMRPAA